MNNESFNDQDSNFFITIYDNIITTVSSNFCIITEFEEKDFIGMDLSYVFILLRLNPYFDINSFEPYIDYYIFTKSRHALQVRLSVKKYDDKIYILFKKSLNNDFENIIPKFEEMYKSTNTGFALFDIRNLVLLKCNNQYLNYLNPPYNKKQSSEGNPLSKILDNGSDIIKIINNAVKTNRPFHTREFKHNNLKNGLTYWDWTIIPLYSNGILKYVLEILNDVTKIVNSREILEEQSRVISRQKDLLEAIINNIPVDLSLVNSKGNCIKLKDLYNNEENNIYYKNITYYDINGNEVSNEDSPLYRVSKGERFSDLRLNTVDNNETRYLSLNGQPVYDREGNFIAGIVCSSDITDRLKYHNMLLSQKDSKLKCEIEKNEDLQNILKEQEEFFTNISHELRTPLNVIFSAIQMIEMYSKNNFSEQQKFVKIIKQNCYRLMRLINNIIDLSKIEAGYLELHPVNLDIVNLVEDITMSVVEYTKSKNVDITFDTNVEEKIIACDPDMVERIILNLLSNAIKFTEPNDKIYVTIKDKEGKIYISVKDTGCGIPEDKLGIIFERFRQADGSFSKSHQGSGIGLSLVKKLVELHGGSISVNSKLGLGSEFIVELPVKLVENDEKKENNSYMFDNSNILSIEFSDIYTI